MVPQNAQNINFAAGDKCRGPIGQLVQTKVWKLEVGRFKKIECNFPRLSQEVSSNKNINIPFFLVIHLNWYKYVNACHSF
jgi:hypothetical protein